MKTTQEQVIAWAREAGWQYAENDNSGYEPLWRAMHFAYEAGRKDENEACAVIAFNAKTYIEAAAAIRARMETNNAEWNEYRGREQ